MRIFCELRSIFPSPAEARKSTSNEQKCPLVLYAKPSNKRFIIPLQKIVILQLASNFLVRVFRNTLIPSVKMTLTMNNWIQKIPRTAKLDSACGLVQFWLSSEFFSSNSFQIGQHVVRFHIQIVRPKIKFYKSYTFSTQDLRYILRVFLVGVLLFASLHLKKNKK